MFNFVCIKEIVEANIFNVLDDSLMSNSIFLVDEWCAWCGERGYEQMRMKDGWVGMVKWCREGGH